MGRDFGSYELKEKIGHGGMASVYMAVQKSLQRPVVLKILYPHLAEDEQFVQRFEREARAAGGMRHENIIQVIDFGRHGDDLYIALEFVEGSDLEKWIKQHGTPPVEMALLMLRDMARGLEHAHGRGIIHRDVKPANMMLTPAGAIKIMDFGLARGGGEAATQMTMVGTVLGTAHYMSPEQATGERVDERADVFSLGVVAYRLLGGCQPFPGDTYSTVIHSILTTEPIALDEVNPLVAPEIAGIVRRMLEKDPAKRHANMRAVRKDLDDLVERLALHRGTDLVAEYVQDPAAVAETWRQKRVTRHLDLGLHYETMGLGKIDDALLEFRRVLHLDADHKVAREHVKRLERERGKAPPPVVPTAPASDDDPGATRVASPASSPSTSRAGDPPRTAARAEGVAPVEFSDDHAPPRRPGRSPGPLIAAAAGAAFVVLGVGGWLLWSNVQRQAAPEAVASRDSVAQPASPPPSAPETSRPAAEVRAGGRDSSAAPDPLASVRERLARRDWSAAIEAANGALAAGTLSGRQALRAREMMVVALAERGSRTQAERVMRDVIQKVPRYRPDSIRSSSQAMAVYALVTPARTAPAPAPQPPPQATPAPAPQPSAPVAEGNGTILVTVEPFGDVYVDDRLVGTQKQRVSALVPAGRHRVRVVNPGYPSELTQEVVVERDARVEVPLDFGRTMGTIVVSIRPDTGRPGGWGQIYINGTSAERSTPGRVTVKPGRYEVSLVPGEGWRLDGPADQTVSVKAGETVQVRFALKSRR